MGELDGGACGQFGSRRLSSSPSVFVVALSHGCLSRVDLCRVFVCPCVPHRLFCSSSQSIARVRNTEYENFDVTGPDLLPTDSVASKRKASKELSRLVKLGILPCDAGEEPGAV